MAYPLVEPESVTEADYSLPTVKRAYFIPKGTKQFKYFLNTL
jgi:hypothetical protein